MQDKRGVEPSRNVWQPIGKCLRGRCPACGEGRIFRAYLKVNNICPHCGEELFHHRADDAPPYLTILIVGHIVGSLMLLVENFWPDAPLWLHAMIWPTLALILSLWLQLGYCGAIKNSDCGAKLHLSRILAINNRLTLSPIAQMQRTLVSLDQG